MGVLDQAIREHLALKRQHGADPGELARLEQEALGPPVRETQEVLTAATGPPTPSPGTATTTPAEPEPWADEAPEGRGSPATAPFDAEQALADEDVERAGATAADESPPAEPAPPAAAVQPGARTADPADTTGEPTATPDEATVPAPETSEPAATRPEPAEPAEPAEPPSVEDLPAEGEAAEDVLEETPEFLQETPEHDRLWFEQKPPRDFDFDG
jgi:hypothetical protein